MRLITKLAELAHRVWYLVLKGFEGCLAVGQSLKAAVATRPARASYQSCLVAVGSGDVAVVASAAVGAAGAAAVDMTSEWEVQTQVTNGKNLTSAGGTEVVASDTAVDNTSVAALMGFRTRAFRARRSAVSELMPVS